jgi:hypothetical protein
MSLGLKVFLIYYSFEAISKFGLIFNLINVCFELVIDFGFD